MAHASNHTEDQKGHLGETGHHGVQEAQVCISRHLNLFGKSSSLLIARSLAKAEDPIFFMESSSKDDTRTESPSPKLQFLGSERVGGNPQSSSVAARLRGNRLQAWEPGCCGDPRALRPASGSLRIAGRTNLRES